MHRIVCRSVWWPRPNRVGMEERHESVSVASVPRSGLRIDECSNLLLSRDHFRSTQIAHWNIPAALRWRHSLPSRGSRRRSPAFAAARTVPRQVDFVGGLLAVGKGNHHHVPWLEATSRRSTPSRPTISSRLSGMVSNRSRSPRKDLSPRSMPAASQEATLPHVLVFIALKPFTQERPLVRPQ